MGRDTSLIESGLKNCEFDFRMERRVKKEFQVEEVEGKEDESVKIKSLCI